MYTQIRYQHPAQRLTVGPEHAIVLLYILATDLNYQ
jgi:hypothetical protein